jgi:hypothetical protein
VTAAVYIEPAGQERQREESQDGLKPAAIGVAGATLSWVTPFRQTGILVRVAFHNKNSRIALSERSTLGVKVV